MNSVDGINTKKRKKSKHVEGLFQKPPHGSYVPGFKINYSSDCSSSSNDHTNMAYRKSSIDGRETNTTATCEENNSMHDLQEYSKPFGDTEVLTSLNAPWVDHGLFDIAERCKVGIGNRNNTTFLQCIVVDSPKSKEEHTSRRWKNLISLLQK